MNDGVAVIAAARAFETSLRAALLGAGEKEDPSYR